MFSFLERGGVGGGGGGRRLIRLKQFRAQSERFGLGIKNSSHIVDSGAQIPRTESRVNCLGCRIGNPKN